MIELSAHVVDGRVVTDEPIGLPNGAKVRVYLDSVSDDEMSAEERRALDEAIERGIAEADRGELIDADELLAELYEADRLDAAARP